MVAAPKWIIAIFEPFQSRSASEPENIHILVKG